MIRAEKIQAYEIVQTQELNDIHSVGYLLRHKKTGARISLVSNEDENKVFYIGFRTPPEDSTGIAHIIEHSVLCGSRKFPSKDPFVELVKGSLNTFLNAMTYPDKTIYPVASCNDKDFANLMDVYLDAVFYPNIYEREEIFKQEGWHYEMLDTDGPITINGVVYNEMKGAFSSPDSLVDREISNSLFPDNAYGNESGGDPEFIPELTREAFLSFHAKYYHPTNSYIYLYGNMDMEEKLNWLDQNYLSDFDQIELNSAIQYQTPFTQIREVTKSYPVSEEDSLEESTYLSYNMAIGTVLDKENYLAFEVLDYALLSAPGAPLKQALINKGIGKDILGSFDNGIFQPVFSIVAKNAELEQKEEFKETIISVLKEQVNGGLNKKSILAAINSMEFKYREADFGAYPKGLIYGISALDSWLYDDQLAFVHLCELENFAFLKSKIDTHYFHELIKKHMLENTHVSMVTLIPEKGLNQKMEDQLAKKLSEYKASLTSQEVQQLRLDTQALKSYQEEPSKKEDMEKIPVLSRGDLKTQAPEFLNQVLEVSNTKILFHEMFTSGIHYLNLMFNVRFVTQEDLPLLGILKAVLGYMDTKEYSYQDFSNEINLETGGINSSIQLYQSAKNKDKFQAKFEIHGKALYEKLPNMMELIEQMLTKTDFSDEKRLKEIISELKSRLQMSLSSAGHSYSSIRALSYFSKTSQYSDLTSGIAFYQVVADYEKNFEVKKKELIQQLERLAKEIFTAEGLFVSITCDQAGYGQIPVAISQLKGQLYKALSKKEDAIISCEKKNEGFTDSSKVQYVSRAGNFADAGFTYTGALKILKVILSYDYLWNNVRVKGGAYGCGGTFLRNGNAYFSSYRDPNLKKTNEIYNKIPDYIEQFEANEREMTKYIIGTLSDLDTPMNPSTKGLRSASAYLSEITYEDVQKEREEILSASKEDIQQLGLLIKTVLTQNNICVIGNEDKIKSESDLFDQVKKLW